MTNWDYVITQYKIAVSNRVKWELREGYFRALLEKRIEELPDSHPENEEAEP